MDQYKRCILCGEDKPLDAFPIRGKTDPKRRGECAPCGKERDKQRYHHKTKFDEVELARRRETNLRWYRENLERQHARVAKNHRDQREACLNAYGRACACCGEDTYEFLAIDHINGGGQAHRKTIGGKTYRWLVKQGFPPGFRTLCHNCNSARGYYGACPHGNV